MTRLVGVLLAGGLARRMGGGDKSLKTVGGRPILERVVERLRPQVDVLIINANGDPARFRDYPFLHDLPVVADTVPDFAGPLAGVLAALDWAADHVDGATDVLSVATDCPFLPRDLAAHMTGAREGAGAQLACARSGPYDRIEGGWQTHPVIGLWPLALRHELRRSVVDEEMRKIDRWTARYPLAYADFRADPVDPFFNANAPQDLVEAERLLAQRPDL
ncbi:molybdenum cofactor guanylyltransferase MobA [Indioceanicola profundi]|uniref:molybdenum cofactor guanylyltransferase MobA n=1 Tax=Indioceanicola profundi TaxID=2220096 RepID=UPI000E6AC7FE|nr:molybdenum cofactor guanylyltransferase MobA [Indioceanicola profundi]